jgi:general secretion pathway protein D
LDVGVVPPDTVNKLSVHLSNENNYAVAIKSAEVSCPLCTHVTLVPQVVDPGKGLDVPVEFTPSKSDAGRLRRSVTFHTDDPKHPTITIPIEAYITPSGGAWPAEISLEAPQMPGTDASFAFEIVNVSDKPLTPLYATGPLDGPKLTVRHDPIAPGKRAKVTGTWHLPAKAGPATGQVILYVDHPELSQINIPYQATIADTKASGPATRPAAAGSATQASRTEPADSVSSTNAAPRPTSDAPVMGLPQAANQVPVAPQEMINLELKDSLPLKDVVEIVATQLKLNLIYDDAALNAPVSVRLSGPLPSDALLPLLKTLLQSKGLALVPTDRPEIWRIVTSREAQALTEPGRATSDTGPAQIVTEFITPQSVDIETAAGILRTFLTPNVGQLTSVPKVKSLIVTDYASQLARLKRLMDLIDKPQAAASVSVVPIKSAEAGPLADRVSKLLMQIAKAEGRPQFENVFISPSDDGAGIVLVGPEAELARVQTLVKQFDTAPSLIRTDYPVNEQARMQALETIRQVIGPVESARSADGMPRVVTAPQRISVLATEGQHRRIKELLTGVSGNQGDESGTVLRAYRIQNRDAAELYATLTRLVGDSRSTSLSLESVAPRPPSPGISDAGVHRVGSLPTEPRLPTGRDGLPAPSVGAATSATSAAVNITIDQGTNTLLIAADAATHGRLRQLIEELDRKQAQVLLEVTLVSVADSQTFAAAVDAAFHASIGGSTIGVGTNNGPGTGNFVSGRTPVVAPGLNAAIFNPASFSVFLSALETSNKARVLSAPQILALDNKPALLRSIQQQPFTSVNASTTVATTSFGGFAEAGTTLEMTPHIAPADYLNLEYRLEVSSFTGNGSGAGVPPPKRSDAITSFVSVPDGSTVVLGGLKSSNVSKTVAKVPGLGEIPILGWIGRNQSSTDASAAFYVFVRPTILRASKFDDLKGLTTPQRKQAGVAGDYPETKPRFIN